MRLFGMNYDTGFVSGGTTTHEKFEPETVRDDLRVIRDELRCDAVRITGGVQDRLELAARFAAEAGLEVWYCPFTNGLDRAGLTAFLLDGAERAERLRRTGAPVVYLTGSEISLCSNGFLPGRDLVERMALLAEPARMRAAVPAARAAVHDFLARTVPAVRERFGGPVSYASLPLEAVDWALFDIIASDAGYRDATNAATFPRTWPPPSGTANRTPRPSSAAAPSVVPAMSRARPNRSPTTGTAAPRSSPPASNATTRARPAICTVGQPRNLTVRAARSFASFESA